MASRHETSDAETKCPKPWNYSMRPETCGEFIEIPSPQGERHAWPYIVVRSTVDAE